MRQLCLIMLTMLVSVSAQAEDVLLPVRCASTADGIRVWTAPASAIPIAGPRKEASIEICDPDQGRHCHTMRIHSFEIKCGARTVPFYKVAAHVMRSRGVAATIADDRVTIDLGQRPLAALNPNCRLENYNANKPVADESVADQSRQARPRSALCNEMWFTPQKPITLPAEFGPLKEIGARVAEPSTLALGFMVPMDATKAGLLTTGSGHRASTHDGVEQSGNERKLSESPIKDAQKIKPPHRTLLSRRPKDDRGPPPIASQIDDNNIASDLPTTHDEGGRVVRVASASATANTVTDTVPDKSSWQAIFNRLNSFAANAWDGNSITSDQRVQQSIVATMVGLALITSLISGIGWFTTQQLLTSRSRQSKSAPQQPGEILRRSVSEPAQSDIQMSDELRRTSQALIRDINERIDEIGGAAALRGVLSREVRSMDQFVTTTTQDRPGEAREWRRIRLRLQRVVTDLIRLKEITEGAHKSLTAKIVSDELPRDKQEAFEVLGANPQASEKILKRLVDALRATWHPDLANDEDDRALRNRRIKQINVAWDIITEKRGAA
ncbi:MAG: hypothetical protein ACR2PG_22835 [Hyphomicrobiaceae bacterium]